MVTNVRRVVLLEADTINRFSTERILRREDYWLFATDDPAAAIRVAAVSAIDFVLVDVGLGLLEAIPRWQRRRGDPTFNGVPRPPTDGYAVLRPLHADPHAARFPVVTLKQGGPPAGEPQVCRFAVVDFLPRPFKTRGFSEGLDTLFRDLVRPAPESVEPPEAQRPAVDAQPAPAAATPRPFASTPIALRTAVVVDPDEGDRRRLVACLADNGFSVHEAATAADGLRLAVARRPWLVITEAHLPDQSGLAFCRRVRSHSLLRRTPVVFLSARDGCERRYEAMKAGADDYLLKPAPSRELLIRLELLLRRFSEIELGGEGTALRGAVELVGAPAVLQICHLNQLTGVLVARRGSQSLRIAFRHGQVIAAIGPDHDGPLVVYDFVGWPQGQFEFDRDAVIEGTPIAAEFNALLLEGCRRLDERRRGRPVDSGLAPEPPLTH